jgi:hypothetical protein
MVSLSTIEETLTESPFRKKKKTNAHGTREQTSFHAVCMCRLQEPRRRRIRISADVPVVFVGEFTGVLSPSRIAAVQRAWAGTRGAEAVRRCAVCTHSATPAPTRSSKGKRNELKKEKGTVRAVRLSYISNVFARAHGGGYLPNTTTTVALDVSNKYGST